MDGLSLVGLLSERDVLHAVAEGRKLQDVTVDDYMTRDVVTVGPEADVEQAAAAMITLGSRHLPVREGGAIVGVVSARDLLAVEGFGELVAAALKGRRAARGGTGKRGNTASGSDSFEGTPPDEFAPRFAPNAPGSPPFIRVGWRPRRDFTAQQ